MKNFEKVIEIIVEKIENLECKNLCLEYENKALKEENAKLNEFLNPTKREGDNE